eukprot:gb/GECH01014826.1/.p1 GENE.gb/GECH01014826.1/~~gb/GECH01014826.1/.p1  ORF type:complete len:269 (+),score=79.14 gb/GECH01014826.1/:1-807(+)
MAQLFEQSLEDIIQQDQRSGGGGRGPRRRPRGGRGGGPQRRRQRRRVHRTPYDAPPTDGTGIDRPWQHDLFNNADEDEDVDMGVGPVRQRRRRRRPRGPVSVDTAVRVRVDNLDYAAANEDLEELIRQNWTGGMRHASVNFDESGRSKESGVIVFDRMSDARQAVQALDRVEYNGRVLRFSIEEPRSSSKRRSKPSKGLVIAASRPGARTIRDQSSSGGRRRRGGRGRGRGGGGGGGRRGRRRANRDDNGGLKSMEELDRELEQTRKQ